jgi:hypothetical protein
VQSAWRPTVSSPTWTQMVIPAITVTSTTALRVSVAYLALE